MFLSSLVSKDLSTSDSSWITSKGKSMSYPSVLRIMIEGNLRVWDAIMLGPLVHMGSLMKHQLSSIQDHGLGSSALHISDLHVRYPDRIQQSDSNCLYKSLGRHQELRTLCSKSSRSYPVRKRPSYYFTSFYLICLLFQTQWSLILKCESFLPWLCS